MNVKLVSYTPNPDQVCDMACRTCTSVECPDISTAVNKTNALRKALDSGHESVAEHAVFTFQIEGISRACSHQLVRHRMASYSQQSQRYVTKNEHSYVIPDKITECDKIVWSPIFKEYMNDSMEDIFIDLMDMCYTFYDFMIDNGIPMEDARYILPNACCTNITVTMNARELRHFFKLRLCKRAQWEIRELAESMYECVKNIAPVLFEGVGPACIMDGKCKEKKRCDKDE